MLREIGLFGLTQLDEAFLYTSPWEEGPSAALLAAVELARRLARLRIPERKWLGKPNQVAAYLMLRYQTGQEVFGALFLDVRRRLIAKREIFRGTLTRTSASPREIVKLALLHDANSLIVFHSHPSGDPAPSAEDLLFTQRLKYAVELMDVKLDDHLILGLGGRFVSLRSRKSFLARPVEALVAPAGAGHDHHGQLSGADRQRRYRRRFDALGRPSGFPKGRARLAPERIDLVNLCKEQGTSNREIARQLGVTEKAVRKLLRRLGWKPQQPEQLTLDLDGAAVAPVLSGPAEVALDEKKALPSDSLDAAPNLSALSRWGSAAFQISLQCSSFPQNRREARRVPRGHPQDPGSRRGGEDRVLRRWPSRARSSRRGRDRAVLGAVRELARGRAVDD